MPNFPKVGHKKRGQLVEPGGIGHAARAWVFKDHKLVLWRATIGARPILRQIDKGRAGIDVTKVITF